VINLFTNSSDPDIAKIPNSAVLTWPEGNGHLMKLLYASVSDHIHSTTLAYKLELEERGGVTLQAYDLPKKKSYRIKAERVILASPQFIKDCLKIFSNHG